MIMQSKYTLTPLLSPDYVLISATVHKRRQTVLMGAKELTDFFIYERDKNVAIEANTARALDFLRSSKYELHDGKFILLNEGDAYSAFDAIDAVGYSTMTQ